MLFNFVDGGGGGSYTYTYCTYIVQIMLYFASMIKTLFSYIL